MSFVLTRLRVEQLRQFRQPFELAGLEPGLNIVTGPNEAGKSTLVRAIRAAFFERHRSTAVEDLRPWGDGAAAPTIELDFRLDALSGQLAKSFLGRKRCTLQLGPQRLEGVEAEEHLAERFGFSYAAKGGSRAEHWGIPGLLWVEQGSGQALDVSHAREHLHGALRGHADVSSSAGLAGAVAATGGDALLAGLSAQRDELLTGTGKPRAALKEAIEQAEALATELADTDARIAAYRQQVDALAELLRQRADEAAERPAEALQRQLDAAQQQAEALQQRRRQLDADRLRQQQLAGQRQLLAEQIAAHARQEADAERRAQALAQAREQAEAARRAEASAAERLAAAERHSAAQRQQARRLRDAALRADLSRQLGEAQATRTRLQGDLQRAEAEQAQLDALRRAASSAIEPEQVEALRKLDRQRSELALQQQALATRLSFTLDAGRAIELHTDAGPTTLQGEGEQRLTGPATLTLPGLGRLQITPGGGDVADLARRLTQLDDARRQALQRAGVADLAEAEQRLAAQAERAAAIRLAEQALKLVAPQGVDALRRALAEAEARQTALGEALGKLPPPDDGGGTAEAEPGNVRALSVDGADAALAQAEAAEASLRRLWQTAQQQLAAQLSRESEAQRELDTARAGLADPQRLQRQAELQPQLLATSAELDALGARIAEADRALAQARADIVAQDIERFRRSLAQLATGQQQRHDQILRLEAALEQAGAQGLEEQRASQAGELARVQRRRDELQRRADALDLLCRRLEAGRQATLARLQAPLQRHLQGYVRLLFPSASLHIDAQLAPGTLTRELASGAIETGSVEALSFGAREQLGLIARFAYADLLREAGRPTLLILDDALVHSDAPRLTQMKRVLFDAAQRHQLLLFTCHPEDWRDMGAPLRALSRAVPA